MEIVPVNTMRVSRELMAKPDESSQGVRTTREEASTSKPNGISVMKLAERPRQTRARAPRARTGCKECKRRHIKCDEGKPSCQRCLVGGRLCEGLAYSSVATLPKPATTYNQMADRESLVRKAQLFHLVTRTIPSSVKDNTFNTAQEWDNFQFWVSTLEPSENLPEVSLTLLTPQVAHLMPAVKEVCCACGALTKTMSLTGHQATEALAESSYHYSKSAALLRASTSTNDDLLSVCVASLLFTTYEMLSGQPEVAFSHYKYASLILDQYLAKRTKDAGVPFARLSLTELERGIADAMQRLSTYPWAGQISMAEGSTSNRHIMSCCKGQVYTSILSRMPDSFDTITTASRWWDATQHFVMHHSQQHRTGDAAEQVMWTQCANTLHNWHASFAPFFNRARKDYHRDGNPKAENYLNGLILETLYLESRCNISKLHVDNANLLPMTKPLFQEIVTITRGRIPELAPFLSSSMSIEKMFLRPLAYVLVKCESTDVIQQVHDALKAIPKPGHIGKAMLAALEADEESRPLGSAMYGWMWDFLMSGHAVVSFSPGHEGGLMKNFKTKQYITN